MVFPGHGSPIIGKEEVRKKLTLYRDAIRYVHDETVKGMNEGKDVHTLMKEIQLPVTFRDINDNYGRVSWSVRGIVEGYRGWFDGNPARMYDMPVEAVYPDFGSADPWG